MAQWGGKRPGSGKPKGYKHRGTLEKERAHALLVAKVIARLGPTTDAQLAKAEGTKFLVLRDRKTGKFIRLAEAKARKLASKDYELVEVWEHLPSTEAYAYLVNQALGKAVERYEHDIQGTLTLEALVTASKSET